ncbi:helix-turn-helix domain-containing protein [Sporosarcina sp. FSL K6-5500]|uniref:helix-turn-helix domain-containing protein n=1 Tax=Sporosarcina sp. FSL K6-5500 TaxID=2921558 RepID=UPI0030F7BC4C
MNSTLGARIKELRNQKKLSQKEFGKLFALAESTIGMYERDERKPDYETLESFAEYFGVTTGYLLGTEIKDFTSIVRNMGIRQGQLENEEKHNYLTEKEKEEYKTIQEFFNENHRGSILDIIKKCVDLEKVNKDYEPEKLKNTVTVAGKEFDLTKEDYVAFLELKKHPIMFNDLKSDPEAKVKELIKLYKMKKMFLENDKEEYGDGFGDFED